MIMNYNPMLNRKFIADKEADLAEIKDTHMGDTCLVCEKGATYVVDSEGNWVKMEG